MANPNKQNNTESDAKYTIDANGKKTPVMGNGFNGTTKELEPVVLIPRPRLGPMIGGSPLGGFGDKLTGYGKGLKKGDPINKLDSVKSLFKNTDLRPSGLTESSFLSSNYLSSIGDTYTDDTYDIGTIELIEWSKKLNNKAIELEDMDFIFLKNLGVYTNNRLIIARRFPFGIYDDLLNTTIKDTVPVAKLISWVKDGDNFIDIDFEEKWEESEASFVDILNGIGKDITTNISKQDNGTGIGTALASGGGLVPLAGFTEVFQYNVLNKLAGDTESTVDFTSLPQGNPNLIRESHRRSVPNSGKEAFSGVKGKFTVSMKVEYEQKYVFGIDPSFAYYSIIANALSFGTSVSSFNFTGNLGSKLKVFVDNISSGSSSRIITALLDFVKAIVEALKTMSNQLISAVKGAVKGDLSLNDVGNKILGTIAKGISSIINKYKVKIIGVINSLTGTPSGPWHLTIGNPKHPIFSSGDMICEGVKLTLGNTLAFNDLPSSIMLEMKFVSARNLGGQEIFQKLNCGKERTYATAEGFKNGIDYLTVNNDIGDAATAIATTIVDGNAKNAAALNVKSAAAANTDDKSIAKIVDDINAILKKPNDILTYIDKSIAAVDQGTAIKEWLTKQKNKKSGDINLDDLISWTAYDKTGCSNKASCFFKK